VSLVLNFRCNSREELSGWGNMSEGNVLHNSPRRTFALMSMHVAFLYNYSAVRRPKYNHELLDAVCINVREYLNILKSK